MKRSFALLAVLLAVLTTGAHTIFNENVKSLQVVVNDDWMSMPVMRLGTNDRLHIGFDELSHTYHRYKYRIEHLEIDGTVSEEIFVSDFLKGFNDVLIEDYVQSINTNVLYTHYDIELPNSRCQVKMSGNYKLTVLDEDEDDRKVLEAFFFVVEPLMNIGLSVDTNTDIDYNGSHQQVSMSLLYNNVRVTNPEEQIYTVVWQNGINDVQKKRANVKPNIKNMQGLEWSHNRELIFEAGNEFRKFEMLDNDRPSMGVDRIRWDGEVFNAWLFTDEPRPNYLTDVDADGAFIIRNSDNSGIDYTCDYVNIHFTLRSSSGDYCPTLNGAWTTDEDKSKYNMQWDEEEHLWQATLLLKQGYYSYEYLLPDSRTGQLRHLPSEGNFFQTENRYQAMAYYKGLGERTWRLVAYQQVQMKQ